MRLEIDMSGKIEQTDLDTVVAFSNNHQYAVLLPRELKRSLINKHRKEKQIILKLFVICVYYTLKDYLHQIELIIIDNKYKGKQNYIKSLLLDFIRRDYRNFDKNLIKIAHITKKSKAHEFAANVKRDFAKPQKTLSEKDIERMIQGALASKPASAAFSAKLRHGLAWHPSSTLLKIIFYYLNFSVLNRIMLGLVGGVDSTLKTLNSKAARPLSTLHENFPLRSKQYNLSNHLYKTFAQK